MSDGSSQGLFVVVAIVIFGIFVFISYLLFKDTLKPSLANIYCDSFEQVGEDTNLLDGSEGNCVGKFHNSFEVKGYIGVWFQNVYAGPDIWTPDNTGMRTINLKKLSSVSMPIIEDGYVLIDAISDNNVGVKQEAIDKGFGNNQNRSTTIDINGVSYRFSEVSYGNGYYKLSEGARMKVNAINHIKITYTNVHGGKTTYNIQVRIINE
ncbi:hypothetical protein ABG980_17055 [Enterococcus casseliflavus]|uniref:hypothetical protein n=1 Tax=Enterococcus TaxID=1350 RepID=UPI0022E7222E|nr:hypothetical protein [Enterococcus casseliflavus]MDB1695481.1 hypothetical protein [Enterococcus casseliflavus]MDB1698913.1 hypothetical protein [Enterococcus casseliflavus]MDB1703578.1 hypothetical protein [Enterococcus casseliflavus]MDB1706414.1 hypothetical protein [Enterococcus casseliflavus]